jgi:hypothetical protein
MRIKTILTSLLLASVVSLSFGGYLLYANSLVPVILVETTGVAVVSLIIVSYFVWKGSMIAVNVATILGLIAPFITFSSSAHLGAISQIGSGGLVGLLGLLQILGFDVFPITYVIIRVVFHRRIKLENVQTRLVPSTG